MGTLDDDRAQGVSLGADGSTYLGGWTRGRIEAPERASGAQQDGFVARLAMCSRTSELTDEQRAERSTEGRPERSVGVGLTE